MSKLSNDRKTGQPTINGQPASKQVVRDFLHQDGEWQSGEFVVPDMQPTKPATGTRPQRGTK